MNRIWVRLSLAFGSVLLLGVMVPIILGILATRTGALRYFMMEQVQEPGDLIDELVIYYHYHESWDNVETVFRSRQRPSLPFEYVNLDLSLLDENRRIIFNIRDDNIGQQLSEEETSEALPILVDDTIRGYLNITLIDTAHTNDSIFSQRFVTFWLVAGFTSVTAGVVIGTMMSRSLTAPLRRLAEAARAFAARDLNQRVEVGGSAEMIEVATAFNDMATKLQNAEMLRRNMVADVAHELRTPLSVLQGNLRAILDDVYPLEKAEVARLYDQTRLLSHMVNDLHELAQAEARQLPMHFTHTDMADLVENVAGMFAPVAEAEGVGLKVDVGDDLPDVRADSARLSQVMNNLLVNALRHTPKGGCIELRAARENGHVRLDVEDTGEGISRDHLPHVFERFYRADRARSRATGGAGLGLAIAKAIIHSHNGDISVSSEGVAGKGTIFTIRLPVEK